MEFNHDGFVTTVDISGAHQGGWELLADCLVVRDDDGKFTKVAPGICIVGFELNDAQFDTLKPVKYNSNGLVFKLAPE